MRYLLSILIAISVAACLPPSLVDDLPGPGLLVEASWLADQIDRADIHVVHVASDESHVTEGHLPGARHLPISAIVENTENQLNVLPNTEVLVSALESAGISNQSHVVLYGDMNGLAATRAFFTLDILGHDRVSILDGGRDAWEALGYDLIEGMPEQVQGSFHPEFNSEIVVDADWVETHRSDERYALLDARPTDHYTGDTPGDGISRPGHIPGAHNLFWQNTLHDSEVATFRDKEEIASLLSDAGLDDDQTIVAYCRTGIQASHAYFTARLLGKPVRLYDRSFNDWSNNTDYPVERG